jgi:DNA invertase Pin-like site-specific DNA recombinase
MADDGPRLIGLIRVSTGKQAESGLGLEGQRAEIERYRDSVGGVVLHEYMEVESGTHDDIESRPQLKTAVAHALYANAKLVIAKLDRMVRSISVMAYLDRMRVQFVACDNPNANELTIHLLAVVAEDEAKRISLRTKSALKAYRKGKHVSKRIRLLYPDGVPAEVIEATAGKLGAELPQCRNLTGESQAMGTSAASVSRQKKAREAYVHLEPFMSGLRAKGLSYQAIAHKLNAAGHKTRTGETRRPDPENPKRMMGGWSAGQVKRVLDRLA